MKLTEKQKKFCDYYIQSGNGAESARRAGYKGNNHDRIACENLRKLEISNYVKLQNDKLQDDRIADMKEVKQFWTELLRDNEAEKKDRLKASEYIAKTNAAFIERSENENTHRVLIEGEVEEWAK